MNKSIMVNGEVVADDWGWIYDYFKIPCIYPGAVRAALQDMGPDDELTLEINSVGGDVFAGFEIYSVLRAAACRTVAFVESLAASAASTIMSACDDVRLSPVAQVMIHQPATRTSGNIDDHRNSVRFLESIEESILNGYTARCGSARRSKLKALMDAETWPSAADAIELGLADSLWAPESSAAAQSAANGTAAGIVTNGFGLHDPAELLARYEDAVRNGAAPVEGHPVTPAAVSRAAETQQVSPAPLQACSNAAGEPERQVETVEVSAGLEPWQMEALVELERER